MYDFADIMACVDSDHVPNAGTIQALEDAAKREGLIETDDFEDLFQKLGI